MTDVIATSASAASERNNDQQWHNAMKGAFISARQNRTKWHELTVHTSSLKKRPPLACYNFDTCERTLAFFGRNVTDKVSNQKTLYCATSNNLCFCIKKHENCIFSEMLYLCIAWIQPIAWFLQSFRLTTHTHAAVWFPKSCNQCVQLEAVGSMVQDKRSRERCRCWTVLHAQCTSAVSSGFPISQGNAETLYARWENEAPSDFLLYQ